MQTIRYDVYINNGIKEMENLVNDTPTTTLEIVIYVIVVSFIISLAIGVMLVVADKAIYFALTAIEYLFKSIKFITIEVVGQIACVVYLLFNIVIVSVKLIFHYLFRLQRN